MQNPNRIQTWTAYRISTLSGRPILTRVDRWGADEHCTFARVVQLYSGAYLRDDKEGDIIMFVSETGHVEQRIVQIMKQLV